MLSPVKTTKMHSIAEFIQKVAETNEKKIVELPQNLTDFLDNPVWLDNDDR